MAEVKVIPNDDAFYEKYHPEFNQCILPNLATLGCAAEDMCSWGGCMYETFGDELVKVLDMVKLNPKRVWTILESEATITIAAGFHYVNRMGYLITDEEWTNEEEQYICEA